MCGLKNDRIYSNFFASGLRAITTRARRRPTSMFSSPSPVFDISQGSSSTPQRDPPAPVAQPRTRSRPSSMFVPSVSAPQATSHRKRRSSIVSFPSRFIDRMSLTTPGEPRSSLTGKSTRPKTSSGLRRESAAEISEVWITAGGPFTPSDNMPIIQPIDPFAASPDAKSYFIDLTDSPSSTPTRESFLSLSASSRDSSIFHLPRRERPTSVQTMPLPPRSQRSSVQYRPPSRDKYDFAWILEEASPIMPQKHGEDVEEWDETANIDWRQFHVDLLHDVA